MTASPGPLARFARWAADAGGFPRPARQLAGQAIADTLACMAAGRNDEVTQALRAALLPAHGTGPAAVVGGGSADPGLAALINGTAAHVLDFDDNFRPGRCHASAVQVPALMALAAAGDHSGAQVADAYVVGLEAQAFVGRGLDIGHNLAGWHPTGTVAAIGSAAGAAWLLGLGASGIAAAMANTISMAAGLKLQFGTAMKPLHAGLAARAAVEGALLAHAGIAGNPDALDHPQGFRALYHGLQGPGWPPGAAIGTPLSIERDGVVPKLYPCCGSTHYVLDMVYDLRRCHGFSAHDVVSVTCEVGPANFDSLPYPRPTNARQARFSMPYCVALALSGDMLSLADFTDQAVIRPAIRALLPLTVMRKGPGAAPTHPHRVEIVLGDGQHLTDARSEVRGFAGDPFTQAELQGKIVMCLAFSGMDTALSETVCARLRTLADTPDPAARALVDLYR